MDKKKETTDELLASRRAIYGDRVKNMERTAQLWSALLGVTIEDWQVPLMMSAYKMLRTFETPDYSDNSDDIDGWKKMFVEVMQANHGGIIQARTVEEYQAQKNGSLYHDRSSLIGQIENLREQLDGEQKQQEKYYDEAQSWKRTAELLRARVTTLVNDDASKKSEGSGNPYRNISEDDDNAWNIAEDQRCSWKDPAGRQCTYPLHAPSLPHHVRNIHTRERGA